MSTKNHREETRLAIEIDPGLRKRIEAAAAESGISVRDYAVAALREALDSSGNERLSNETREWARLSIPAFARDRDSDADAIYDDLAYG